MMKFLCSQTEEMADTASAISLYPVPQEVNHIGLV